METEKIIEELRDFYDLQAELINKYVSKGRPWIKVDFNKLSRFSPTIADELLLNPTEILKIMEIALERYLLDKKKKVRVFNLPKSQSRKAWEVRNSDIGKFIALQGIINKSSSIIHECHAAKFECPQCGLQNMVLMQNKEYKVPARCTCQFRGKHRMVEQFFKDYIKIGIADDMMDETNKDRNVSREKMAELREDLTCLEIDKQLKPGRKVVLNGVFEYRQIDNTTEFESIFNVNSIEFIKVGWDIVQVNDMEEMDILEEMKNPHIVQEMAESIADVQGSQHAKIACLLLLAGAPTIYDSNKHLSTRGTIHILLIGNPGSAKTFLAKRAGAISPIYSFQSAATASGKGLVASVAQDPDLKCWAIYPGVVAMAHKGVVVIDEIDKTHEDDYGDHNNAMNDMEVPLAKANVKGRLDTETSYLATANPENRMFSTYSSFYSQIDMPKDFIDRFDIIFPMVTPLESDKRDKIMETMLQRHNNEKKQVEAKYTHEFIRKYIAYCRQKKPHPELKPTYFDYIKEKLSELMKPRGDEEAKISFRQLESVLRFAYASARLHMRDITKDDIDLAFDLKKASFLGLGIIDEAGFSWAKMENIDVREKTAVERCKAFLHEMMPASGATASLDDYYAKVKEANIMEEEADKVLMKLKERGDFMEPRRGMLQKI